jgi:hypothetical protein
MAGGVRAFMPDDPRMQQETPKSNAAGNQF